MQKATFAARASTSQLVKQLFGTRSQTSRASCPIGMHIMTDESSYSGPRLMPNSRVSISILAFVSGFMLIWLLTFWAASQSTDVASAGPFRLLYIAFMFSFFAFFWIYFFRRPRGDKTFLDGRTALSGSAFIVGASAGYASIDFGLLASHNDSAPVAGNFMSLVGCTLLPIMAWLVLCIITLVRRKAILRSQASS